MRTEQVDRYRDQRVTITVDYADEPIYGELIAVANPPTEDPIGAHTAAVVLLGDGAYVLIDIDSIKRIRVPGSLHVAR